VKFKNKKLIKTLKIKYGVKPVIFDFF